MNPRQWLTPNQSLSPRDFWILSMFWTVLTIFVWELWRSPTMPSLPDMILALGELMGKQSFYRDLGASLILCAQALGLATILSLSLSYLYALPVLRPVVLAVTKMRFLSIAGLSYLARQMFVSGDDVKLSLLTFGKYVTRWDCSKAPADHSNLTR